MFSSSRFAFLLVFCLLLNSALTHRQIRNQISLEFASDLAYVDHKEMVEHLEKKISMPVSPDVLFFITVRTNSI